MSFASERLAQETITHTRYLWGAPNEITPILIDEIFGDGEQLIGLTPIMTRTNYYVIRIDSSWALDNFAENPLCDYLDEIYDAIETQCGCGEDCGEEAHGEPDHICDGQGWPALCSGGSSWFSLMEGEADCQGQ